MYLESKYSLNRIEKYIKIILQLLDIRVGPGAAILPNNVKKIHLNFAQKVDDGHYGARRVWRVYLPRLKYHNPAVSMTVKRTAEQEGPATLFVHFASPSISSFPTAPAASPTTLSNPSSSKQVETIDMKHKSESEILSRLLEMTKAMPYEATPDELAELRDVEDYNRKTAKDRAAQSRLNQIKRQEQALLDQARGAGKQGAGL